jgi:hypothetical protein
MEGHILLLSVLLCFRFLLCLSREEPNATPFELLALLLLALPLLFTLQKFVLLAAFGERNHQFVAAQH